jgi:archaemetzincin
MGRVVKGEILLVPVGAVPTETCGWLVDALPPKFDCTCHIASALPHPASAWNARREQYLADTILAQVNVGEAARALAIADLDLYVPDLNFVFGLADRAGARAIIALPRLRQSFYGWPENVPLFRERAIKEAVHELGHTFGLGHCRDRRCVMAFSNSLADTDYKGQEFCERCYRTRKV